MSFFVVMKSNSLFSLEPTDWDMFIVPFVKKNITPLSHLNSSTNFVICGYIRYGLSFYPLVTFSFGEMKVILGLAHPTTFKPKI